MVRPLAEHAKELSQLHVIEDEMQRVVVEQQHVLEGRGLVCVDEGKVPCVQESHHVLGRTLVHWYTTVPGAINVSHHVVIEYGVDVQTVDILQFGHHVLCLLLLEGQHAADDVNLVLGYVVVLLSDVQQLQQLVPLVDRTHLLPQHQVEEEAEGKGYRKGQDHEDVRYPDGGCPYQQAMAGTHSLGHYLPEDDDAYGCHGNGNRSRHDVVQEDGDATVHGDVPKQDCAQEVVPILTDAIYQPGTQLLPLGATLHNDLQGGGVKRHQAKVEPGEQGRKAEEQEDDKDLQGKWEQGRGDGGVVDSQRLPRDVPLVDAVEAEVQYCS